MSKIREKAKLLGIDVVGKLSRRPEWEKLRGERAYIDEAGNEYCYHKGSIVIVTFDGGVLGLEANYGRSV